MTSHPLNRGGSEEFWVVVEEAGDRIGAALGKLQEEIKGTAILGQWIERDRQFAPAHQLRLTQ